MYFSTFYIDLRELLINVFKVMQYIKCGAEKFEFEIKPLGGLCKRCQKEIPVVSLTTQNLKLCKSCFNAIQEKRVYETVKKFRMFNKEDRIGIFLSGGKDSASLATLLKRLFPDYSFQGIYLNLGIGYYSEYAEKTVRELCEKIELPLFVYNLPKEEGFSIDEFVFTNFRDKICSVCGVIKRYLFSKMAKALGLTVIATGHHLDDLLSTYLTLFFNGDFLSLKRLSPVNLPLYPGQAKKVKPLCQIPERELFYYAILNELPLEGCACPHGEITPAKKIKFLIEELSKENRTFKYQLMSVFLNKFLPLLKEEIKEETQFKPCLRCGEPTASANELCNHCRRIELLERVKDRRLELTFEEWLKYSQGESKESWVIFDVREKEDYLKGALPEAKWISKDLLENERELIKTFKPFRDKNLLFYCYTGRLSYFFTLKLRKLGFKAYNLKHPEEIFNKVDTLQKNV
ncbi:MAG: TIGR00269 family protein [Caldimicrobium thiodismutans]|uniref:TIGR00269 family protein n=1 Tax=Caldimicrobium thiodismutans TaxID=1653476 RepID=A0A2N7PLH9_9BACT|nr:MAG: TIGR00269 family protein [Caldimicrobium thiodismutans]